MWLAELKATFRRTRVRVCLLVLLLIPLFLAVAVLASGKSGGGGPTFLNRVSHNGVFTALAALVVTVPFFLPLTVAVVSGDAIAGEAGLGTLRYLLARPAGRLRLLGAKGLTIVVFCLAAGLSVAVGGLIAGAIFFPLGPVTTLSGTTIPLLDGVGRTLLASLVVGASLLGLGAIGLFVSTLTDVPQGAVAATVGAAVIAAVLDALPEVSWMHPWLFTNDWQSFPDLLRTPVIWGSIVRDLLLQLGYAAVFATAAWARFTTRDVLA